MTSQCPYTGLRCDGGTIHADGTVGCGYRESPGAECAWAGDVPEGVSPRDFYNGAVLEATRGGRA